MPFTRALPMPYKVIVQSLKSGKRKELFEGDTARYLRTGHIVYAVKNNFLAVPFDSVSRLLKGDQNQRNIWEPFLRQI